MKRALRIVAKALAGIVILAVVAFAGLYWFVSNPSADPKPLPEALVAATEAEGAALLARSQAKADHAGLAEVFQPQRKRSWCGVASAVAALRSIGVAPTLTQESFFTDRTSEVRSEFRVTFGGMNLDELGGLLEAHGAKATVVHAADTDVDRFRSAARENLADATNALLVNYQRERLGQGNMGHISPVAAYDEQSDRLLVLDTATYKWPPVWVEVGTLFDAMSTVDTTNGKTRGYVEVGRP